MGFTYHINKGNGVVFTVWEGERDVESFEMLQRALRDDPDFEPYYSVLTDLRDVTKTDIPPNKMRQIAQK